MPKHKNKIHFILHNNPLLVTRVLKRSFASLQMRRTVLLSISSHAAFKALIKAAVFG